MTSPTRQAGFVLVEALAALVVTAIAAAGLLAALASARDRAEEAASRSVALREARHLLAEGVGGEASALALSGSLPEAGLSWSRSVSPLREGLASVIVEVSWTARRRTGTIRLETYRFIAS